MGSNGKKETTIVDREVIGIKTFSLHNCYELSIVEYRNLEEYLLTRKFHSWLVWFLLYEWSANYFNQVWNPINGIEDTITQHRIRFYLSKLCDVFDLINLTILFWNKRKQLSCIKMKYQHAFSFVHLFSQECGNWHRNEW